MNEPASRWNNIEEIFDEMSDLPEFAGGPRPALNSKGYFGNTPLKVAAVRGDVEAIRLLVSAGAEIDSGARHYEAAALLLQLGASSQIKNDFGYTSQDLALWEKVLRFRDLFAP